MDLNRHPKGYARIYRFVPAGSLGKNVVTHIDRDANITFIDRDAFDIADASQRSEIFKSQSGLGTGQDY